MPEKLWGHCPDLQADIDIDFGPDPRIIYSCGFYGKYGVAPSGLHPRVLPAPRAD